MRIKVTQEENIPNGFYCKECLRKEKDRNGFDFCTLFNKYLYIHGGNFLKCRECVNAVYDALEKRD